MYRKKSMVYLSVLLTLVCVFMVGCGKSNTSNPNPSPSKPQASNLPSASLENTTNGTKFVSNEHNFEMVFPKSWGISMNVEGYVVKAEDGNGILISVIAEKVPEKYKNFNLEKASMKDRREFLLGIEDGLRKKYPNAIFSLEQLDHRLDGKVCVATKGTILLSQAKYADLTQYFHFIIHNGKVYSVNYSMLSGSGNGGTSDVDSAWKALRTFHLTQ